MHPRGMVRTSTFLVAALAVGLLTMTALTPGAEAETPLRAKDGSDLVLPAGPAVVLATWQGLPVLVFKVHASTLEGDGMTPSIAVPGEPGLRLFAISAKSTHLGCTVDFLPSRAAAGRGVWGMDPVPNLLMDPCHLGRWDPFRSGEPIRGGPAPTRLPLLDAHFEWGVLVASHYDGPVGRQR